MDHDEQMRRALTLWLERTTQRERQALDVAQGQFERSKKTPFHHRSLDTAKQKLERALETERLVFENATGWNSAG